MGAMRTSNWGKNPKDADSRNSKNERNNKSYIHFQNQNLEHDA